MKAQRIIFTLTRNYFVEQRKTCDYRPEYACTLGMEFIMMELIFAIIAMLAVFVVVRVFFMLDKSKLAGVG
tara:strand:+ start:362 stop:574 length:213 start_codon:yes stop_codon:yes gene_type:complete